MRHSWYIAHTWDLGWVVGHMSPKTVDRWCEVRNPFTLYAFFFRSEVEKAAKNGVDLAQCGKLGDVLYLNQDRVEALIPCNGEVWDKLLADYTANNSPKE